MERCGAPCVACRCIRTDTHGVHVCDCGGSWVGEEGQPNWCPVSFPQRYVGPREKD